MSSILKGSNGLGGDMFQSHHSEEIARRLVDDGATVAKEMHAEMPPVVVHGDTEGKVAEGIASALAAEGYDVTKDDVRDVVLMETQVESADGAPNISVMPEDLKEKVNAELAKMAIPKIRMSKLAALAIGMMPSQMRGSFFQTQLASAPMQRQSAESIISAKEAAQAKRDRKAARNKKNLEKQHVNAT